MAAKIDIDFARIKAFAFDVDGVFTDGGIFCDLAGELFKATTFFNKRTCYFNDFRIRLSVNCIVTYSAGKFYELLRFLCFYPLFLFFS